MGLGHTVVVFYRIYYSLKITPTHEKSMYTQATHRLHTGYRGFGYGILR